METFRLQIDDPLQPKHLPPAFRRFAADLTLRGVIPETSFACLMTAARTLLGHTHGECVEISNSSIVIQENSPQAAAAMAALDLSGAVAFRVLYEAQHHVFLGSRGRRDHDDLLTKTMKLVSAGLGSKVYPPPSVAGTARGLLCRMRAPEHWSGTREQVAQTAPGLALSHADAGQDSLAIIWRVPPSLKSLCRAVTTIYSSGNEEHLHDALHFAWNSKAGRVLTMTHIIRPIPTSSAEISQLSVQQAAVLAATSSGNPQMLQNASGSNVFISSRSVRFCEAKSFVPQPGLAGGETVLRIRELDCVNRLPVSPGASAMQDALRTAVGKFTAVSSAILYLARGVQLTIEATAAFQSFQRLQESGAAASSQALHTKESFIVLAFIEAVLTVMLSESGEDLTEFLWKAVDSGEAWPILRTGVVKLFDLDANLNLTLSPPVFSSEGVLDLLIRTQCRNQNTKADTGHKTQIGEKATGSSGVPAVPAAAPSSDFDQACPMHVAAINAALTLLQDGFPIVHRQFWSNSNAHILKGPDNPLLQAVLGMQTHDALLKYWQDTFILQPQGPDKPFQHYTIRRKLSTVWLHFGLARQVRLSSLLPCKGSVIVLQPVSAWPDTIQKALPPPVVQAAYALSPKLAPFVGFWSNEIVDSVLQAGILLTPSESSSAQPDCFVMVATERIEEPLCALTRETSSSGKQETQQVGMDEWAKCSSKLPGYNTLHLPSSSDIERCAAELARWVHNSQAADHGLGQFSSNVLIRFLGETARGRPDIHMQGKKGAATPAAAAHDHLQQRSIQVFFVDTTKEASTESEDYCVFVVAAQGQLLHSVRCICAAAPSEAQLRLVIPQLSNPSRSAELFIDEYPQMLQWLHTEDWGHIALAVGIAGLIMEAHRTSGCLSSVLPRLQETLRHSSLSMQKMLRDSIIGAGQYSAMTLQEAELASWASARDGGPSAAHVNATQRPSAQAACTAASQELAEHAVRSARRRRARRQWESWCMSDSALSPAAASSCSSSCHTPGTDLNPHGTTTTTVRPNPLAQETPAAAGVLPSAPLTWSAIAPASVPAAAADTLGALPKIKHYDVPNRKRYAPLSLDAALLHSSKQARPF